jgi:hypothetical protein
MDFIFDKDRTKYIERLIDLQSKVNPKPHSQEQREQIIKEKLQSRNNKILLKGGIHIG